MIGDVTLLHSRYRAGLVAQRDQMLEVAGRRRTWSISETNGTMARAAVRADTTKVVSAVKGVIEGTGRGTVLVGFGERVDDAYFVALSIPDARDLVHQVQHALDAPLPSLGVP